MTDLVTLAEWGAPLAAMGGGALYARHAHPAAYWSTVGLPVSVASHVEAMAAGKLAAIRTKLAELERLRRALEALVLEGLKRTALADFPMLASWRFNAGGALATAYERQGRMADILALYRSLQQLPYVAADVRQNLDSVVAYLAQSVEAPDGVIAGGYWSDAAVMARVTDALDRLRAVEGDAPDAPAIGAVTKALWRAADASAVSTGRYTFDGEGWADDWRIRLNTPGAAVAAHPEAVFFDGRNAWEAEVGRFKNAIVPDVTTTHDFISEIERGQKEASSELLASISSALNVSLGEILIRAALEVVDPDRLELPGDAQQDIPEMGRLEGADDQVPRADLVLLEQQRAVHPRPLGGLLQVLRQVADRRGAARQAVQGRGHVGGQAGRVDLETAHDPVDVGVLQLDQLVQPVDQFHVRIAPQLAEHRGALDGLVGDLVELAGRDVEDETAQRFVQDDERAGLDPAQGLTHVLGGVGE